MNQAQQSLDVSKITELINKKEVSINNAEKARIQAETKKDGFRMQYDELNKELKSLGVEPKEASKFLAELEAEIIREIQELEMLVPEGY